MVYTIARIATALGGKAFGAVGLRIAGAAEPAQAGPRDLALAMDEKYAAGLASGQARAALLWPGADWQALGLEAAIEVPRARYAMSALTTLLDPGPDIAPGVDATAIVGEGAEIGEGAAIGAFVVIGPGACIGPRARIASHTSIAEGARIGADALLHSGVRIGARVEIGDCFIAQPGAVVGADGFSFVTPETSAVEQVRASLGAEVEAGAQRWTRIHSLGTVVIGDDVELGANTVIDRGTIRATRIGRGSKLDNLVHIGHNVEVGEDCLLCGQVGIAGSSRIGDRVVMAGQCGVSDNIFVGDDVVAGGATKIFTNVPAGRVLLGSPAVRMQTQIEIQKALRRLPRLMKRLARGDKPVSKSGQKD